MKSKKRIIKSQLDTISGNLQRKFDNGSLVIAEGRDSFACGRFTVSKDESGYKVTSSRAVNAVCEGLTLVESAILVAVNSQKNDFMASDYIVALDGVFSRYMRAMEAHSHSVKMAIKEHNYEQKDIMYSRYLFAKDRVAFYRHKIKSKSNIIVEKR